MGDPLLPPKPVSADKLLAQRLEPLIAGHRLKLRKRVLYYTPIGLYLRGYWLQKHNDKAFLVNAFVHPLYAMTWAIPQQFGERLLIPGAKEYWNIEDEGFPARRDACEADIPAMVAGKRMSDVSPGAPFERFHSTWFFDEDGFEAKFNELLAEPIPRSLADLTTGVGFERFLDLDTQERLRHNRVHPDWEHPGRGWAALHRGELACARQIFARTFDWFDTYPPMPDGTRRTLPPHMETMHAVAHLIDNDPGAIPAHCDAVARQAIANLKMTNVWEPTPFQYTG